MIFKVGDKVTLKEGRYYVEPINPVAGTVGYVLNVYTGKKTLYTVEVDWGDHCNNIYKPEDIMLVGFAEADASVRLAEAKEEATYQIKITQLTLTGLEPNMSIVLSLVPDGLEIIQVDGYADCGTLIIANQEDMDAIYTAASVLMKGVTYTM